MDKQNPVPGWNWTAEYQVSGIPFVTSSFGVGTSVRRLDFDYVTRTLTISVSGSNSLRLGFTENGVNGVGGDSYFLMKPDSTTTFDVRVKSIFYRADAGTVNCSILAGCTTIPARQMLTLSGSSVSGSLSWRGVG